MSVHAPSVDRGEVDRFARLADTWWDPKGAMAPLHKLNPARLAYIRARLVDHFALDITARRPLAGLRLLDIGCGGGLLSEPLARMGGDVVGADATAESIDAARAHADRAGLAIDYRHTTAEALAEAGERFDAIVNMEVVEHVADVPAFLATCRRLVADDGCMLISTLNRTARSFALAIVGAEYVLGWLPRGTHDWRRFMPPAELSAELDQAGFAVRDITGLRFSPTTGRWSLDRDTSVNYLGYAVAR